MKTNDLPLGKNPPALIPGHFPTLHQAVVWRNWNLVSNERLAVALGCTPGDVLSVGREMGLPDPVVSPFWPERGYVTIIRNNWHLLPYEQLLILLDWTPTRMAFALKEEDFLWNKLGNLKPAVPPVRVRPLTSVEQQATQRLRKLVEQHFPDRAASRVAPFDFVREFGPTGRPPPHVERGRPPVFDLRLMYPYHILYGDPLLDPELGRMPEGLFEKYAQLGVNAIWLQGVLYQLTPIPSAESWSEDHQQRVTVLNRLTDRARDYGIGVYLYLNEPRCMPLKFFEQFPDWRGELHSSGLWAGLCTSQESVRHYLREAATRLFQAAPGLEGVFAITMSENQTNCWSKIQPGKRPDCKLCRDRHPSRVVADVLTDLAQGVHAAKPSARVIAWNWSWRRMAADDVLEKWPANVELMCGSEEGLPLKVGGVDVRVTDYTMAHPGPGPLARELWQRASAKGIRTLAKVQANTTWECPAVPWIPVPGLMRRHINGVRREDVRGLMLSWTLGGYPSVNLLELADKFWPDAMSRESRASLRDLYSGAGGDVVRRALAGFDRAFAHFPFDVKVAYVGPQNPGPANLLYLEPTGYGCTMVGFPYDCVDAWRGPYPRDVFERQLRLLSAGWLRNARLLDTAAESIEPGAQNVYAQLRGVAWAVTCHFRSMYLQTAFLILRDELGRVADDAQRNSIKRRMRRLLREDMELAKRLYHLSGADSTLGFEATNHYIYTSHDLMEKVLNIEYLLRNRSVTT